MRTNKLFSAVLLVAGLVSAPAVVQGQGKVIASHDEWFTYQLGAPLPGWSVGDDDLQFITNSLNWFGVSAGNSILIYSDNPLLANAGFTNFLSSLGVNAVVNENESASNFSDYAAVFVSANTNVGLLTDYVRGGGNVFDIAGTGTIGSASDEAAYNNAFLNNFGLGFAPYYQGLSGDLNTSAFASQGVFGAALFTGVNTIFAVNGNDVSYTTTPVDGVTNQVFYDGEHGLYGTAQLTATPEPASIALMATGLFGLIPVIRRHRRRQQQ